MSLNKYLYSYHHKKFEVISFFKVRKKMKRIYLHVHLLVEQRALYKHF